MKPGVFLLWLLAIVLLTRADGDPVWIVDTNVVAVEATPRGSSTARTMVVTMGGVFFVREAPDDVARRLGWKK